MTFGKFIIRGRTALVTGGARGIGLECAKGLMEAGCDVGLIDLIECTEDVATLEKEFGVKVCYYKADVSNLDELANAFASFEHDFKGKLDICVPCAGINDCVEFLNTTPERFDRLHGVNFRGAYFTAQHAAKLMLRNGTTKGTIVFICSMASYIAIRSQQSSAYCGTKGAVRSMVAPIAAELASKGIRANSLSPGYIRTAMTEPFPELIASWGTEVMNQRVASPADVAGTCVFLASDASSYIIGEDIVVDGGVTKW